MEPIYDVEFIIMVVGNGVNEGSCRLGDTLRVIREYDNPYGRLSSLSNYWFIWIKYHS